MKITGIRSTLFACRNRRARDAGAPSEVPVLRCVIELSCDEGLLGVAIGAPAIRSHLQPLVEEILLGEDPRGVAALWQRMMSASCSSDASQAIAALDIALWDLKAKANGEPLWKTLGGSRPRVNVHAGGCDLSSSDAAIFAHYDAMAREFGFRSGVLKVGLQQDDDVRRLGLMQKALLQRTAEPSLMIDAGQRWSPKEALRNVREMENGFDLTWVEEPARCFDFLGLKRVSDGIRAAVCAGESLAAPADYLAPLHHHALDIVQVDTAHVGITGALQIADTAYGFELPIVLTQSPGNLHAHLGAVMPYCMSMEVVEPVPAKGTLTTDVWIEDGWAIAGDRPGHGLMIDHEALAKASRAMSGREATQ